MISCKSTMNWRIVVAIASVWSAAAASDNKPSSANIVPGEFCDPNSPLSISGYLGVEGSKYDTNSSKQLFYWLVERRSTNLTHHSTAAEDYDNNAIAPLIIWLNGGPGCSSLLGLLMENGPCLVNQDGTSTNINQYSWTEVAHMLYLDQPSNTGYSYGPNNDVNSDMTAEDTYYFLQHFFQTVGNKYKDSPLFIAGESYAGHYIPAISHRIVEGNRGIIPEKKHEDYEKTGQPSSLVHINLAGLAIGNGAINREVQLKYRAEMAYHNSHNIQLVNETMYRKMKAEQEVCGRDVHQCKHERNELDRKLTCQKMVNCMSKMYSPIRDRNVSSTDISKPHGNFKAEMTPIRTFLNLKTTKETMGVPLGVTWSPCSDGRVEHAFGGMTGGYATDWLESASYLETLLNDEDGGIRVLIYNGDLDYVCNYMGGKAVALSLDWKHGNEYRTVAVDHDWGNGAGLARSYGNLLTYLQVYDAGHMTPSDQPEHSLMMIEQFINEKFF